MANFEFKKLKAGDVIPAEIKELYMTAFPPEERRPWADIEARVAADPAFNLFLLYHDDECAGFITIWTLPGYTYVEHFAIFDEMRGKGLGSLTITALLDPDMRRSLNLSADAPLVLEVEPAEFSEQARKRIDFYRRCGMNILQDFRYIQPPYHEGFPEVELKLMASRPIEAPEELTRTLHTLIYNRK